MHSIILTVHNKGWLIDKVIESITKYTASPYELIIVLDGCTDNSEQVVTETVARLAVDPIILYAPNVFETPANNMGLKKATGDKAIIIQDDTIIKEFEWNLRMENPFIGFGDVFAVTARTAHNWKLNPNCQHLDLRENLDSCWCDILDHVDHASQEHGLPRDIFAIRSSVNRGPLMIDLSDLKTLNYLDEEYAPQDMDDHDLMYRMYKKLGKVCGCYWINMESKNEWEPAPWLFKAHHKNTKIFYQRHKDILESHRVIEDRKLA